MSIRRGGFQTRPVLFKMRIAGRDNLSLPGAIKSDAGAAILTLSQSVKDSSSFRQGLPESSCHGGQQAALTSV